jgi:hypothetical protein
MKLPPNMDKKKEAASKILLAYGVKINNDNQLRPIMKIDRVILDQAYDAAHDFKAVCKGQFKLLLVFLKALKASATSGNAAETLLALKRINLAFGCQVYMLPTTVTHSRWTALSDACDNVPVSHRQYLTKFYSSRKSVKALPDIEEIFYKAGDKQALEVMKVVMERKGDHSGINTRTIKALVKMLAAHKPMSKFMGFTQWGPGDNGNPDDNLNAHVLKHVCRQPVDPQFGVAETIAWWKALRITLTLPEYDQRAVNPMQQARICFDGGRPLAGDGLKKFLVYQALQSQPALTQFMKNRALIPYRDFAIDHSRVMSNVIVHSNGTRVFISGSFGDVFIIGRFEGVQLGISSCYRPLDLQEKLNGARANMCWPLR